MALDWLKANGRRRFFAVYNPVTPHHPYDSPDRTFQGADLAVAYKNALHHVDAQIGRLLTALRELGLEDDTLVVAIADPGEDIGVGHGFRMNLEEIRVPAMVALPGRPPRRVETLTTHLDIAPTLAGLLGLRKDAHWLGRDLTAPSVESRVASFGSVFGERAAVLDGEFALAIEADRGESLFHIGEHGFEPAGDGAIKPEERSRLREVIAQYDRRIRLRHLQRRLTSEAADKRPDGADPIETRGSLKPSAR